MHCSHALRDLRYRNISDHRSPRLFEAVGSAVCFWALALFASVALGQPVPPNAAPVPHPIGWGIKRWSTSDGLPDNRILAIIQDHKHFIWTATRFGLARFDGTEFRSFTRKDNPDLPNTPILSLAEDSDGVVYACSQDGAILAHDGRSMHILAGEERRWRNVRTILGASALGGVLVATDRSLSRWRLGHDVDTNCAPQLPSQTPLISMIRDRNPNLAWIGSVDNLVLLDENRRTLETTQVPGFVANELISGLFTTPEFKGVLVLVSLELEGTDQARQRYLTFNEGVWTPIGSPKPVPDQRAYWAQRSRHGGYWTPRGVSRVALTHPLDPEREITVWNGGVDWARCGLEDAEGNLWLGTMFGGLVRLRPLPFSALGVSNKAAEANTRAVLQARDGTVWVGTDGGLIGLDDDEHDPAASLHHFTSAHGLPQDKLRAIARDASGKIWTGSTGLGVIDPKSGRIDSFALPIVDNIPNDTQALTWNKVRCLLFDQYNNLWVGLPGGLLHLGSDETHAWCDSLDPDDPRLDIRAMTRTRRGAIWLGTSDHGIRIVPSDLVARLGQKQPKGVGSLRDWQPPLIKERLDFPAITSGDGLSDNKVWTLLEDKDGSVWAGTEHGLNHIQSVPGGTNTFHIDHFTTHQGLPDNVVNIVLEDDFGNLWIGHDNGIYEVAKKDLAAVAAGSLTQARCTSFDEADGIPNRETNGQISYPSGAKGPDGRLWFCTVGGLAVIDPTRARFLGEAPVPVIEDVLVDDAPIARPVPGSAAARNTLTLLPGQGRTLEFRWTSPNFDVPGKIRFRYRMQGFDRRWHDASTRRAAFYSNLPPGEFTFQLEATDSHGITSVQPTTYAFVILPHFWQTPWFPWVVGTIASIAIWTFVTWRSNQVRRIARLEHELSLASERKRIARDIHDGLGGNLTSIATLSQLGADTESDPARIAKIAESSTDALRSLKTILWITDPRDASLEGLAGQLCTLAQRTAEAAGLHCTFDIPLDLPESSIPSELLRQLWFAFNETVTNIVRHAHATEIRVLLRLEGLTLRLSVEDNGRGFDVESAILAGPGDTAPTAGGRGLGNIRNRMASIGGSAIIQSLPGRGTQVQLVVPLPPEALKPGS